MLILIFDVWLNCMLLYNLNLILFMFGPVEGSSPTRFIKRTHNRNPTFHSFHVFGALHHEDDRPVPEQGNGKSLLFLKEKAKVDKLQDFLLPKSRNKSTSNCKIDLDSLSLAEKQFASKIRNPLHFIDSTSNNISRVNSNGVRSKSTNYLQQSPQALSFLNFGKSSQIRDKQQSNYDIITNLVHA